MHISSVARLRGARLRVAAAPVFATAAMAAALLAGCGSHRSTPAARLTRARPLVTVPRVMDISIEKGERLVRQAGLVWNPMYSGSAGAPEIVTRCITVLHQGPAPGTRVRRGSPVGVAVGACPWAIAKVRRSRR